MNLRLYNQKVKSPKHAKPLPQFSGAVEKQSQELRSPYRRQRTDKAGASAEEAAAENVDLNNLAHLIATEML